MLRKNTTESQIVFVLTIDTVCRIDTPVEIDYYRNGGILHKVLRDYVEEDKKQSN